MSFPSYWQTWQKYGRLRSKLIALGFFSWTGLSAVWIAVLPFRSCSETGGGRTAATGGLSSVKSVYSDVWSSPIASTSIPGAEVDVVEGVRTVDDAVETRFSRELAITKKSHENESCCVSPAHVAHCRRPLLEWDSGRQGFVCCFKMADQVHITMFRFPGVYC